MAKRTINLNLLRLLFLAWGLTCQGTKEVAINAGHDFKSDKCLATSSSGSLRWRVNNTDITSDDDATERNLSISREFDNTGRLFSFLFAFGVQFPMTITCFEGVVERLSIYIHIIGAAAGNNSLRFNSTSNSTGSMSPFCGENFGFCIAGIVLAIVVTVIGAIIICACILHKYKPKVSTSTQSDDDCESQRSLPSADDADGDNESQKNADTVPVPPEDTMESTLHRAKSNPTRHQRQLKVTRSVATDLEGASPAESDLKPQVHNVGDNASADASVVGECTDKDGVATVFCFDGKIHLNTGYLTRCLRSTGDEEASAVTD